MEVDDEMKLLMAERGGRSLPVTWSHEAQKLADRIGDAMGLTPENDPHMGPASAIGRRAVEATVRVLLETNPCAVIGHDPKRPEIFGFPGTVVSLRVCYRCGVMYHDPLPRKVTDWDAP